MDNVGENCLIKRNNSDPTKKTNNTMVNKVFLQRNDAVILSYVCSLNQIRRTETKHNG